MKIKIKIITINNPPMPDESFSIMQTIDEHIYPVCRT